MSQDCFWCCCRNNTSGCQHKSHGNGACLPACLPPCLLFWFYGQRRFPHSSPTSWEQYFPCLLQFIHIYSNDETPRNIHPLFQLIILLRDMGAAGAFPSRHWVRGGAYPGQIILSNNDLVYCHYWCNGRKGLIAVWVFDYMIDKKLEQMRQWWSLLGLRAAMQCVLQKRPNENWAFCFYWPPESKFSFHCFCKCIQRLIST